MSKSSTTHRPSPAPRRIIVIGGGFAGATLARALERQVPKAVEIVVISAQNHLVFTPLLPEVAARTVSPLQVVVAGRELTQRTRWLEARIMSVDASRHEVHFESILGEKSSLGYAQLVFACGSTVDLSGIPGLEKHGYPLKTVMDAIVMGNDLIANFEAAATEENKEERRRLLTVVVLGGGFSGVEIAGHVADLMEALHKRYPEIKSAPPRVVLLQKGDRILPELEHKSLSHYALKKLRANRIEVRLETAAAKVTGNSVTTEAGDEIEAGMVICTVGTAPQPLLKELGIPLSHGRLTTDECLRVKNADDWWAIGDCASIPNVHTGKPCPATAQFAVQQARHLAGTLGRVLENAAPESFSYRARGLLAAIGHHNAVAEIFGLRLSGFVAWFLWRGVYLMKLPTLARKVEVAFQWAWGLLFAPNLVQLAARRSEAARRQV